MSEDGEMWSAIKKDRQEKRASNRQNSREIIMTWSLRNNGVVLLFNEAHLRINERFDFWPGTGKYLDRVTNEYRRGVFNLIKDLEKYQLSTRKSAERSL